jgi:3-oxoacyl-[acyl-carrier protein] reductase
MTIEGAVALVTGGSEGIGRAIASALAAEGAAVTIMARSEDKLRDVASEVGIFKPLVDMELAELENLYRTNVFGAFLMAREAARRFVEQGSGELINISSTSGLKGIRNSTAYSSSKFALRGMTECWRDELRRHDVRVMLVNPSEVLTDFAAKVGREQEKSPKKLRGEEIADALIGALKIDNRGFVPEFSVFATNPF